jgi:hypothetical protein
MCEAIAPNSDHVVPQMPHVADRMTGRDSPDRLPILVTFRAAEFSKSFPLTPTDQRSHLRRVPTPTARGLGPSPKARRMRLPSVRIGLYVQALDR